jgi:hypothetical protein
VSTWDDTTDTGEYSVEDDNQLQPEDTLVDRGVDDILDEGFSPPERPIARTNLDHPGPETLDELLAEEEPDPVARLNNVLDELEQRTTTPSCSPPTSGSTGARHRPRRPPCTSSTRTDRTRRESGVHHPVAPRSHLD